MKRVAAILVLYVLSLGSILAGNNDFVSLLQELDQTIEERSVYVRQKEKRIQELKDKLEREISDTERFDILGDLLNEYNSFNTDSALSIAEEREMIAIRLKEPHNIDKARINMAEVMCIAGMYKEAVDLMQSVRLELLSDDLRSYYFHIYRTIYGLMADYAITKQNKQYYAKLTDQYRDSLLIVYQNSQLAQDLIHADQYNVHGQYDKAILILEEYVKKGLDNVHDLAIFTYTLSESYRLKGDKVKEKEYLIISAMADMKTAVREYVSLRKLAVLIYKEGDIDRAYSYLKICMEDAVACNARLRNLEILEIFPIVNDAYEQKNKRQKEQMKEAIVAVSLLSFFLLAAVFYIYKQMKKVNTAKREVQNANKRLKELNVELQQYNEQLQQANYSIAENSCLKETYIGRYMDQCSIYIEKMDNYRRQLGKIAASGNTEKLYNHIKSSKFIEDELKEFYADFDNTFLQLFPTFVEDFNSLLNENEQIHPKPNERMNTELRIFALIRLGITDSIKIAQFLRYSVNTIYNYRTKVRNKAIGDREQLEQKLMNLGR